MEEFLRLQRERQMVESWSRSSVGLYEVQEVKAGSGCQLKDLLSDKVLFVHDVNLSNQAVRWDGLLTRVIAGERGQELTGIGLQVPRRQLEPLREWIEEYRRDSGMPCGAYLKQNLPRIRRRLADQCSEWAASLQLTNTDGEELLFSKAVFRVADEPVLCAALAGSGEISEEDEGREYVWLRGRAGEAGNTVLGNLLSVTSN